MYLNLRNNILLQTLVNNINIIKLCVVDLIFDNLSLFYNLLNINRRIF